MNYPESFPQSKLWINCITTLCSILLYITLSIAVVEAYTVVPLTTTTPSSSSSCSWYSQTCSVSGIILGGQRVSSPTQLAARRRKVQDMGEGGDEYSKSRNRSSPNAASSTDNTPTSSKSSSPPPTPTYEKTEIQETLRGGPSLIFEMARKMFVWDDELYEANLINDSSSCQNQQLQQQQQLQRQQQSLKQLQEQQQQQVSSILKSSDFNEENMETNLPRWRPIQNGISNANPSFRYQSPPMNSKGYAGIIRRNSRKRNKPGLWRHAYRTYLKMKSQEESFSNNSANNNNNHHIQVERDVVHFESALVACAKLGLWRESLEIYQEIMLRKDPSFIGPLGIDIMGSTGVVEEEEEDGNNVAIVKSDSNASQDGIKSLNDNVSTVDISDNMILAIVKACIIGAKAQRKKEMQQQRRKRSSSSSQQANLQDQEQRIREPLDAARNIILSMESVHEIPLVSRHVNPLASAYRHVGLNKEASQLIQMTLEDRTTNAYNENDEPQESIMTFNVNDVQAKDIASYNIMIESAVSDGNWSDAIGHLGKMTEVGLYPKERNLNLWSETARKRERRGGRKSSSWKKKRERIFVRGTLGR